MVDLWGATVALCRKPVLWLTWPIKSFVSVTRRSFELVWEYKLCHVSVCQREEATPCCEVPTPIWRSLGCSYILLIFVAASDTPTGQNLQPRNVWSTAMDLFVIFQLEEVLFISLREPRVLRKFPVSWIVVCWDYKKVHLCTSISLPQRVINAYVAHRELHKPNNNQNYYTNTSWIEQFNILRCFNALGSSKFNTNHVYIRWEWTCIYSSLVAFVLCMRAYHFAS